MQVAGPFLARRQGLCEMGSDMKKRPRDPAQLAKFVVDVATGEIEGTPGKAPKAR
jgi:hypothetical protein